MKTHFTSRWLPFLLLPISLTALPENEQIVSGAAQFRQEGEVLTIVATDKTILSYDSFNIGRQEKVQFIQPSKEAVVLNRVVGSDPSKILGRMTSNGRVVLVNPNGVYFGKNAIVDTGSLIVSTLDILDQDFLESRYSFHLKDKSSSSLIHNEGTLIASEGMVALISPQVKNEGIIRASLDKVIFASGEAITLSFEDDGLMSFEMAGDTKDAFIEQAGSIQAGSVFLQVGEAQKAIEAVINTEGIVTANTLLVEENGKVRITHESHIKAKSVFIESSDVFVEGEIDVSNRDFQEKGGTVHILGDNLELRGARINASGGAGGGTVLIGGEYKGGEGVRTAFMSKIDEKTFITADSLFFGNGGRVIIWSDDTTFFDGTIYARGGQISGDGGFVETSGKRRLAASGYVSTMAPRGTIGVWLLDPATITIVSGTTGSLPLDCSDSSTVTLGASTIGAASSTVTLCATTSITQSSGANITMSAVGAGLIFEGSNSTIATTLNGSITTNGGAIAFNSTQVTLGSNVQLNTTGSGSSGISGNITFDTIGTIDGVHTLALTAGSIGEIIFGAAIGGVTPLTGLTLNSAESISFGSNVTMSGASSLSFPSPVILTNSSMITTGGASASFSSTLDGPGSFTLNAATSGTITFSGAVGSTTPLASATVEGSTITQSSSFQTVGVVDYTAATSISIAGNITTDGGDINIVGSLSLSGSPSFDTTNSGDQLFGGNISFSSTVNGGAELSLNAGVAGTVLFSNNVGSTTPLKNLSFTGAALIQIEGNITTTGDNPLIFSEPVRLLAASAIDSNGNDMTFDSTLDGAFGLTIETGAGTATFSGAIGGTFPLTSLEVTAANIVQDGSIASTGTVEYTNTSLATIAAGVSSGSFIQTGGGTVSLGGSISASSQISFANAISLGASVSLSASGTSGITLSSTIIPSLSGVYNLVLSALGGSVSATQIGSSSKYIEVLTLSTKTPSFSSAYANTLIENGLQTISSDITAPGANLIFSTPTTVASGGPFTIDVTGGATPGNITFASILDGPGSLVFVVGDGTLNFDGFVGSITDFGAAEVSSAQNVNVFEMFTGSSFTQTASGGTVAIAGTMTTTSSSGISLTGTAINITGSLITESAGPVAFDNSGLLMISSNINSNGSLSQTGGGTVTLGGSLTLTNSIALSASVSFANPVTLMGDVVVNTSVGGGDITFGTSSTIDGLYDLSLVAGSGDVSLSGEVGGLTPIGVLTIYSAADLTLPAITATSVMQVAGTGTTTLVGAITAIGDAGIVMTGNIFDINASLETVGKGPLILQNTGLLTISSSATINAAGPFLQTGSGSANISGNVTAH